MDIVYEIYLFNFIYLFKRIIHEDLLKSHLKKVLFSSDTISFPCPRIMSKQNYHLSENHFKMSFILFFKSVVILGWTLGIPLRAK